MIQVVFDGGAELGEGLFGRRSMRRTSRSGHCGDGGCGDCVGLLWTYESDWLLVLREERREEVIGSFVGFIGCSVGHFGSFASGWSR